MKRACAPRRSFSTWTEADRSLGAIWSNAFSSAKGPGILPSRVYRCQVCGSFHLTSRPADRLAVGEEDSSYLGSPPATG